MANQSIVLAHRWHLAFPRVDPIPMNSSDREKCPVSTLQEYLDGTLTAAKQIELECHLTSCEACQESIQTLAADKTFWCTAAHALEYTAEDADADAQLRGWLGPTESANALGQVGQYVVHGIVGRGGMGVVLSATDQELGRRVAIKTLANPLTTLADEKRRLLREARASANVRHLHIVPIYSVETWRDVPIIVMPLIEGGTLETYAAEHTLGWEDVLHIASQIASALIALHHANIVHRDIKPSNILLSNGIKHCLLSDFGLARQHGDINVTQRDVLLGTPHFMSPEQALGKQVDARSDLFSLGSILFWLGTGQRPFVGASNYEILHRLVNDKPDYKLLHQRGYPKYVITLLERLLAKEPNNRWVSAEQFLTMVQTALQHPKSEASASLSKELGTPWRRNNRMQITAMVAIVIALSLLAVWGVFQTGKSTQLQDKIASDSLSTTAPTPGTSVPAPSQQNTTPNSAQDSIGENSRGASSLDPISAIPGPPTAFAPDSVVFGTEESAEMLRDLAIGQRQLYWVKKLDSLTIDKVPAEAINAILKLENNPDDTIRDVVSSVLSKDPFLDHQSATNHSRPKDKVPNPFVEVSPFEEASPFVEISPIEVSPFEVIHPLQNKNPFEEPSPPNGSVTNDRSPSDGKR